ncbi:MAG TPA: glycosyltransferase family 2 protein, partial [Candidatus Competibacteraceae bacterium]|nr:glycosyltransferase family 2 protein [Candidatus Competibacteraceae bacterium]
MKDTPLVSLIIPAHNAEGFLAECLESILSQTYQTIE